MQPQPFYRPTTADAAYQLRYSWTGWPSSGRFLATPTELIEQTRSAWEQDHLRVLEYRWSVEMAQILFSATPDVSPEFLAARAKGRLDHALRVAGMPMPFSRKVAVRSVGENTQQDVEAYIARQVCKERFADPRFEAKMQELTISNANVDLTAASETARGRYWCNLHLVLVIEGRQRITEVSFLERLRDAFSQVAAKKEHLVSRLAVMPDHLHAALRARPTESPLEVVFAYQNNLVYLLKTSALWQRGFYVGTFGPYSMNTVRRQSERGESMP